jgi:hypothetical protein
MLFHTSELSVEHLPMTQGSLGVLASADEQLNSDEQEFANILALMHTAPHGELLSLPEAETVVVDWPWAHEDLYLRNGPDHGLCPADTSLDIPSALLNQQPPETMQRECDMFTQHALICEAPGMNLLAADSSSTSPAQLIDSLIHEALHSATDHARWIECWDSASERVRTGFGMSIEPQISQGNGILDHFANIYLDQFQPLWPLLWRPGVALHQLHPLLILTMTSIGALYSGSASSKYGSLLHERMRETLLVLPPRADHTDQEHLDLGRAMLLTQVAALYFEQQHAFSAAQKLGALLNVHAQKMRLFNYRHHRGVPTASDLQSATNISAIEWHKQWVFTEGCKRLAYGIVRAEVFMSVLLDLEPLASYEEVDLELPYSDTLWSTKRQFDREYIAAVSTERSLCRDTIFSDLVRIALDPNEVLPLLQPLEHELLLYGLQYSVWRFSHDLGIFKRLTGHDTNIIANPLIDDHSSVSVDVIHLADHDHLDYSTRKMGVLLQERQNVICALRKWKLMVASSQMSNQHGHNRTTYLGGLILFHLSFLRLHAPVGSIQQIVYLQGGPSESSKELVRSILEWSCSGTATIAIKHACSMWTLIEKETSRSIDSQARYTILTVISVYQAATVIWAVAGACERSRQSLDMMGSSKRIDKQQIELCRTNTPSLMNMFAELFPKMTSTWGVQSSFLKMIQGLAARTLI